MAAAAQAQPTATATDTATDPVQRWLARRGAGAPGREKISTPAPSLPAAYSKAPATPLEAQRARHAPPDEPAINPRRCQPRQLPALLRSPHRTPASSVHRSTPCAMASPPAPLPTEDPEAYQRHLQQFLDEYAPADLETFA